MTWLNKISLFFNVTTSIKVFFCISCLLGPSFLLFVWSWNSNKRFFGPKQELRLSEHNKLCWFFPLFYEMLKQGGIITAEIRGLHSTVEAFLLATQQPRVWYQALQRFLSLLLSLWAVLRSNLSSAKQRISQMQLAVTSRAKYYKKLLKRSLWE